VGGTPRGLASPWKLLALLSAANVLNFVDRQLLAGVAPLVMVELHLTLTQLGLLVGFAFVTLFSLAGMALGTAADRLPRTRVLAAGLAVWSLATAASGAAEGFGHLALARLLVGVGEATLVPAALSLLADAFPPARLGLAAGIFTSGTPVGYALSYAAAGLLPPYLGWRGCFLLLGGLGLPLVGLLIAAGEPPRGVGRTGSQPVRWAEAVSELWRTLASVPSARLVILGIVALAFAAGGALHTITWLVQERGYSQPQAAALSGLVTAGAGTLGNLGVGWLADRRERRGAGGRAATLAALAPCVAAASLVFYTASPSSPVFHVAWALSTAGLLGWLGAALAAYEPLIPPRIRATAVAFAILCLNLLGLGPGALVTGWLGDGGSLSHGLQLSAGVALFASVPFLAAAARSRADREGGGG
jgi:MFS family permease